MRILLLSQWFDPEPTFKGMLFARELHRRGHDVVVLTGFPNYPGGKLYEGYRITPVRRENVDGIDIIRVALYPSHDASGLKRAANYASFALSASCALLFLHKPDVAYVYHPPATVGLPAMVLKHLRGVPFVYDVQDLWPDTLTATGMVRSRVAIRLVGRWTRTVYRASARIAVLSDGFKRALTNRGVASGKIEVIHNWADEAQLSVERPSDARAKELGFDDRFTVVFAGTIGPAQGLDTVLEAAEQLRSRPDIHILVIGAGLEAARLREEVTARGLPNVSLQPRRPMHEIGEVLGRADALLVHLRDDPLFAITVPSKTQAYLLAGRPILMGVRGDAADLVERAKAGLTFTPGDADDLVRTVLELQAMSQQDRDELGANGSAFYAQHLSLAVGSSRFDQVMESARLAKPRADMAKRLLDISVGSAALVTVTPALGMIAALVRRRIGAPILFTQARPGRYGEPFKIYKFRTMTDERDADGGLLPDRDRLTRFGAMLRRTSLDELPELWNVVRGDMSLVGPRPLLARYTEFFTEEEALRLEVRPGITGWAQVNGRNTASWDDRLDMDVWYVRNRSMWLDARILVRTVRAALHGSGVVVDAESLMQNLDDERRDLRGTA